MSPGKKRRGPNRRFVDPAMPGVPSCPTPLRHPALE
jgi:hypothetical protein